MGKHGKRYQDAAKLVEHGKAYEPEPAMDLLKQTATTKFDGSVEAHIRLGVDPRHADQMVRGTVSLPHGSGKVVLVAVFAQGDKAAEATAAGTAVGITASAEDPEVAHLAPQVRGELVAAVGLLGQPQRLEHGVHGREAVLGLPLEGLDQPLEPVRPDRDAVPGQVDDVLAARQPRAPRRPHARQFAAQLASPGRTPSYYLAGRSSSSCRRAERCDGRDDRPESRPTAWANAAGPALVQWRLARSYA